MKRLVSRTEALLGAVILKAGGRGVYSEVERMRRLMVGMRNSPASKKPARLARAYAAAKAVAPGRKADFARAYTLYLELVNVCENAYRTHRLRARFREPAGPARANIVFVLTSHPTESRSPVNIDLLTRVQTHLVWALENGRPPDAGRLKSLLQISWRAGSHSHHKPRVADEATHIYSLLSDPVLNEILALLREGHEIRLRTWVGGDKDGHPGVGPDEMASSLALSRTRLSAYLKKRLILPVVEELSLLDSERWLTPLNKILTGIAAAGKLRPGDGARIRRLSGAVSAAETFYLSRLGAVPRGLKKALALFRLFPGLVVPLELREERGSFGPKSPIAAMARRLEIIARGGKVSWYARGCVVSMVSKAEDVLDAQKLLRSTNRDPLPVIPLFETAQALAASRGILADCWKHPSFRKAVRRDGQLEVMLGYSDSAKTMGALASRLAIEEAMVALSRWAKAKKVRLQFFHGSGGSGGRGGGTIEEQASGWPRGALSRIKVTLQGEMAQRTLATPEILRSQVTHMAAVQADPPAREGPGPLVRFLAARAHEEFGKLIKSPDFRELLNSATPYPRLDVLNIGSRPTKRKSQASLENLRAIPWVLCWTQTRLLLPVWYGIGTAWRQVSREKGARKKLARAMKKDPLLRSYIRLLGFALAKSDPLIWNEYARRLGGNKTKRMVARIESERKAALALVWAAAPGQGPLWDRSWLKESIFYRTPMIHPLNLLQISLLEKKDWAKRDQMLFRETVTGIAAGMLTTG